MTRVMYDSVHPETLPAGGDLYAGYVGGSWPTYTDGSLAAHSFGQPTVSIAVASRFDAMVLDVERGDATPDLAPGWAQRQRERGQVPTVYCEKWALPAVRLCFQQARVDEPWYWIAAYSDPPGSVFSLTPFVVAHQYGGDRGAGWDISVVADHWPGVDPEDPDVTTPIAGTPSWCHRQPDGAFPRFQADVDDRGHTVVASIDNAPFHPTWSEGAHGPYTDFGFLGLWWRKFTNGGQPTGYGEADGSFFVITEHGTFDISAAP